MTGRSPSHAGLHIENVCAYSAANRQLGILTKHICTAPPGPLPQAPGRGQLLRALSSRWTFWFKMDILNSGFTILKLQEGSPNQSATITWEDIERVWVISFGKVGRHLFACWLVLAPSDPSDNEQDRDFVFNEQERDFVFQLMVQGKVKQSSLCKFIQMMINWAGSTVWQQEIRHIVTLVLNQLVQAILQQSPACVRLVLAFKEETPAKLPPPTELSSSENSDWMTNLDGKTSGKDGNNSVDAEPPCNASLGAGFTLDQVGGATLAQLVDEITQQALEDLRTNKWLNDKVRLFGIWVHANSPSGSSTIIDYRLHHLDISEHHSFDIEVTPKFFQDGASL
ncbi:hypothetical protein T439DRAFT_371353 [Meredithblackwellia eburnea MCA 4105]